MCLSIVFVAEVDGFCCLLCIGRVFWNNCTIKSSNTQISHKGNYRESTSATISNTLI